MANEKIVDEVFLKKILRNRFARYEFIKTYVPSISKRHEVLLKNAIMENCESNVVSTASDFILLAGIIGFYSPAFSNKLQTQFSIRRSQEVKLAILDYLFMMKKKVSRSVFEEVSCKAVKSSNNLVSFQGRVNLVLLKELDFIELLDLLRSQKYPTLLYRLMNNVESSSALAVSIGQHSDSLKNMIKKSDFGKEVKMELLSKLEKYSVK